MDKLTRLVKVIRDLGDIEEVASTLECNFDYDCDWSADETLDEMIEVFEEELSRRND